QMTVQGPFGAVKETRVLNTVAARRVTGAQVSGVHVTPIVAKPGDTINVAYAANGKSGYVRLAGSDGTIWAQKPFSSSGAASFVVPPVGGAREMRVLVHVSKGRSTAESSAGFVVAAAAPPAQAASPSDSAGDSNSNGTFQLMTSSVPSGGTIKLQILSPRNDMHIALLDDSTEITSRDVGSDASTVILKAPVVKVPTRYTVVANFTDGFGQESVVEPVTIRP
ncbi:MAG TPA: hypothetical protein VGF18_07725, partial [Candidatus Tumulicola sp.]